ncbi:TIGR00725 family protein [uncultured Desulfuromusa sp.]|uniref:TIGR00725 family protein n=1 Tax=uncultured Desulfuromusa sp. TaxID=219183 RepID=UPI002AA6E2DB|nr:TIGR00725 family protein [uncultured Desulfuromusa sp.]
MGKKLMIGVIGAANASSRGLDSAYRVGRLVAENGAVLISGGLGGVMEAASRGCAEAGGDVLGILPGNCAKTANPYVSLPIVTGMGHARNVIIAQTADALIAIEGEHGTLSEIAIGLKLGKVVVQLNSWLQISTTAQAQTPDQAMELVLAELQKGNLTNG